MKRLAIAGMDLELFERQLGRTANYFRKSIEGTLLTPPIPASVDLSAALEQNPGWK